MITLDTAKAHLNMGGIDHDDALIALYLGAAEESAKQFMGRTIYADADAMGEDTTGIVLNFSISTAILLTLGHLYFSRENVVIGATSNKLPYGAEYHLAPYRTGMGA
jgi:hypothetical protein